MRFSIAGKKTYKKLALITKTDKNMYLSMWSIAPKKIRELKMWSRSLCNGKRF